MTGRAKISVAHANAAAASPVYLASFRTGPPPQGSVDADSANKDALRFRAFQTGKRRLVVGESHLLSYVDVSPAETTDPSPISYAVGVWKPSAKSLSILPCDRVFSLTQQFKKSRSSVAQNATSEMSRSEQRAMLVQAFASRKVKNAEKRIAAGKADANAVKNVDDVAETIQKSAELGMTMDDMQKATLEAFAKLLPPHNTEAEEADQVYPLDGILPGKAWPSLNEPMKELEKALKKDSLRAKMRESKRWSAVVLERLERLANEGGLDKSRIRNVLRPCLVYEYALRVMKMKATVFESVFSDDKHEIPDAALEHFLSVMYKSESSPKGAVYRRGPNDRRTAMYYVLAAAVHAGGQQIPVATVAKDISLAEKTVTSKFREMGCNVTKVSIAAADGESAAETNVAKFKAPLVLPPVRKRRA